MLVILVLSYELIKSLSGSSLTDESTSSCISLKVTKYKPNVESLSSNAATEVSLITHMKWSQNLFVELIFYVTDVFLKK